MAEVGPGAAGGYVAFISYSHKDAAIGRWLHRKLEGYRLPKRLAGTEGEHGEVPARLTPIFRDRDELPAAGDLSEKVRAALAVSRNLIVVCSPHSAASPWVSREIATFRELHPDRPIFTAIVGGEPDRCFPPALRDGGIEPLAADLRKEGDGRRLGQLKLVAGLAGVGLDALVQRDASRRVRRVSYLTAAAVAAMLMMALLTAVALSSRAEAQRQRKEAEGLVEFMLTDLRDRLKGVGRLDILTAVNRRALDYYQTQDLDGLPADSLERRARILHVMGEDDDSRGDLDRALAQFQEARRTTASLLAEKPDDPARVYTHAQSEFWVGLIAWRRGRGEIALDAFRKYSSLTRKLSQADPTNLDWRLEDAYADSNLGTVLLRYKGDAQGAERLFRLALSHFQAVSIRRPEDADLAGDVADGHGWLADALRVLGRYDESLAHRKAERSILERLAEADPKNVEHRQDLIGNQLGLAQVNLEMGQLHVARDEFSDCMTKAEASLAVEPTNFRSQGQLAYARLMLAKTRMMMDSSAKASAAVIRLLGNCQGPEPELTHFCQLLRARAVRRSGPSLPMVLHNQTQKLPSLPAGRYSPRWGIDLQQEQQEKARLSI